MNVYIPVYIFNVNVSDMPRRARRDILPTQSDIVPLAQWYYIRRLHSRSEYHPATPDITAQQYLSP